MQLDKLAFIKTIFVHAGQWPVSSLVGKGWTLSFKPRFAPLCRAKHETLPKDRDMECRWSITSMVKDA